MERFQLYTTGLTMVFSAVSDVSTVTGAVNALFFGGVAGAGYGFVVPRYGLLNGPLGCVRETCGTNGTTAPTSEFRISPPKRVLENIPAPPRSEVLPSPSRS